MFKMKRPLDALSPGAAMGLFALFILLAAVAFCVQSLVIAGLIMLSSEVFDFSFPFGKAFFVGIVATLVINILAGRFRGKK